MNLLVNRTKRFESPAKQKDYDKKTSQEFLEEVTNTTKIPVELRMTAQNAIFFGSEKDLKEFSKELNQLDIPNSLK